MQSEDVVFNGVPVAPTLMAPQWPAKGLRIVPVIPGADAAAIAAAYELLTIQWQRGSQALSLSGISPPTVTEQFPINAPDWIRSPGFNQLFITGGQVGVTYRIWWAIDCLEMVDVGSPPYLDGLTPGTGGGSYVPTLGRATAAQAQNSTANIPAAAGDGVAIAHPSSGGYSSRGIHADVAAPAGQTITGGLIVWWRYNSALAAWCETGVQETLPTGRRYVATADQLVAGYPGDRLYAEARSVITSGGGAPIVSVSSS